MSVSVTLRQEKKIFTDQYGVISWVTVADPSGYYPLFVVKEGLSDYDEEFGGVADLDDLANYVENPLVKLRPVSGAEVTGVLPGDTLTITNAATAVPEWFDTYFTAATFIVDSINDGVDPYIKVVATKPFPTATDVALTWTAGVGSGNDAKTHRDDTAVNTYLRRHFTSLLASVKKANSRAESNKALIESLVNSANIYGASFEGVETDTYS